MIHHKDTVAIGRINKSRGLKGEVEMYVTDDVFADTECPYLLLDRDGLLVPFFWEEYRFKSERVAIVKFEDCETEDAARQLVGSEVRFPISELPSVDESATYRPRRLEGFTLCDDEGRSIGIIESVDESTANVLLHVRTNMPTPVLIPFHPDLIASFDADNCQLWLHIPDGLLEMNDNSNQP